MVKLRKLANDLLDKWKIPHRDRSSEGHIGYQYPSWDGKVLATNFENDSHLIHDIAHWVVTKKLDPARLRKIQWALGPSPDDEDLRLWDRCVKVHERSGIGQDCAEEEEEIAALLGMLWIVAANKRAAKVVGEELSFIGTIGGHDECKMDDQFSSLVRWNVGVEEKDFAWLKKKMKFR